MVCNFIRFGRNGGIEHDLGDTGSVAQINEDHAAVISTPGHPAAKGGISFDVLLAKIATICAFQVLLSHSGIGSSRRQFMPVHNYNWLDPTELLKNVFKVACPRGRSLGYGQGQLRWISDRR